MQRASGREWWGTLLAFRIEGEMDRKMEVTIQDNGQGFSLKVIFRESSKKEKDDFHNFTSALTKDWFRILFDVNSFSFPRGYWMEQDL